MNLTAYQNIDNTSHARALYLIKHSSLIFFIYYMALSHEDWELQNSRIWLAKIDIDRGLDFPI